MKKLRTGNFLNLSRFFCTEKMTWFTDPTHRSEMTSIYSQHATICIYYIRTIFPLGLIDDERRLLVVTIRLALRANRLVHGLAENVERIGRDSRRGMRWRPECQNIAIHQSDVLFLFFYIDVLFKKNCAVSNHDQSNVTIAQIEL